MITSCKHIVELLYVTHFENHERLHQLLLPLKRCYTNKRACDKIYGGTFVLNLITKYNGLIFILLALSLARCCI